MLTHNPMEFCTDHMDYQLNDRFHRILHSKMFDSYYMNIDCLLNKLNLMNSRNDHSISNRYHRMLIKVHKNYHYNNNDQDIDIDMYVNYIVNFFQSNILENDSKLENMFVVEYNRSIHRRHRNMNNVHSLNYMLMYN